MEAKKHRWLVRMVRFLCVSAVAGFIFASGVAYAHLYQPGDASVGSDVSVISNVTQPPMAHRSSLVLDNFSDVASRVMPSVVNLSATRVRRLPNRSPMFGPFPDLFGQRHLGLRPLNGPLSVRHENSLGSGAIIREDGYILTNNHVVEGADEIRVELPGRGLVDATVVGTDEASDLTLLHVDASSLPAISFGDSSQLHVGDVVMAVGNPFGVGQTVTMGIVSATGRANMGINDYEDFIQTDAAINPGSSGGALVNLEGELVGINSVIVSPSGGFNGLGFAIPSNMASNIADALREHGRVIRGWLGVVVQDPTPELAHGFALDETIGGALIAEVTPGSPGDHAGLRSGDLIAQVDANSVTSAGELRSVIASLGAGAHTRLSLIRAGAPMTIDVALGELPQSLALGHQVHVEGSSKLSGVTVSPLSSDGERLRAGIPVGGGGVLVASVAPESLAARSGLWPGDVILEVNRHRISTPEEFERAARDVSDEVLLLLNRGGQAMFLAWRGTS